MTINEIYISAFGGIKDRKFVFSNGLNVVFGENENGKTTIMSFIKMMFYGSGRAGQQLNKNPRKKYTPWDGTPPAGSIKFTHEGRNYLLEREFKASDSSDKKVLTDLDLGTRESVSGEVGNRFFGLSQAAFERSVFIGQLGFPEKDSAAEGEINSRLSNITSSGDEAVSYNTVVERLTNAKTALMSKRKVGEYDRNLKHISLLKEELEKSESFFREYGEYKLKADMMAAEMAENIKKAALIKEHIDAEQDIRNAEKIKRMLEKKHELDELNATLLLKDGGLIDGMFVSSLKMRISRLDELENRISDRKIELKHMRAEMADTASAGGNQRLAELKKQHEDIKIKLLRLEERQLAEAERLEKLKVHESSVMNKRKGVRLPVALLSAAALIGGAFCLISNVISAAVLLFAVGVIMSLVTAFVRPKDTEKITAYNNQLKSALDALNLTKDEKQSLEKDEMAAAAAIKAVEAAVDVNKASYHGRERLLDECLKSEQALEDEYDSVKKSLFELYGKYKNTDSVDEIKSNIGELNSLAAKQKEIKQELNYIVRDLGNISYEEAVEKLKAVEGKINGTIDFEGDKRLYETLTEKISDTKARLLSAQAKAEARLNDYRNPDLIKREIDEITSKTKKQLEFCNAAELAISVLTDSFAELRRGFGSELKKKAGKIFADLTGDRYESMQISKELDISADRAGVFGSREIGFLSAGTADQAYLSLRLAVTELICENGENLPILLDDALAQYDDKRACAALKYLKAYSEKSQVILFTCHSSLKAMADSENAFLLLI